MGAAIVGFTVLIVVCIIMAELTPRDSCERRMYLTVAVVTASGLLVMALLH